MQLTTAFTEATETDSISIAAPPPDHSRAIQVVVIPAR
jgi:hypothetical protein